MMEFGVGGSSLLKIGGVEDAVEELDLRSQSSIYGCPASRSYVNEQPFGKAEGIAGAMHRAASSYAHNPGDDQTFYIGIESTIIATEYEDLDLDLQSSTFADYATVYVIQGGFNVRRKSTFAYSARLSFPKQYVLEAYKRGFATTTVGRVMQEAGVIKDHRDPQLSLIGTSRRVLIKDAVVEALKRILYL